MPREVWRLVQRSILFAAVFGVLSVLYGNVYSGVIMRSSLVGQTDEQYQAYRGPLRVLVVGDSHAQGAVDAEAMGDCFSLTAQGENCVQTFYRLKHVFEHHANAKEITAVVLPWSLHTFSSYRTDRYVNEYYWRRFINFPALGWERGRPVEYLGKFVVGHGAAYLAGGKNVVAYLADRLQRIPIKQKIFSGFRPTDVSIDDPAVLERVAIERARLHYEGSDPFDPFLFAYWCRTIDLCEAHGKVPILVRYPVTRPYHDAAQISFPPSLDRVSAEWLEGREKPVAVLDMLDALFDRNDLFYDGDHLNSRGASLLTPKLVDLVDRVTSP